MKSKVHQRHNRNAQSKSVERLQQGDIEQLEERIRQKDKAHQRTVDECARLTAENTKLRESVVMFEKMARDEVVRSRKLENAVLRLREEVRTLNRTIEAGYEEEDWRLTKAVRRLAELAKKSQQRHTGGCRAFWTGPLPPPHKLECDCGAKKQGDEAAAIVEGAGLTVVEE